MAASSAATSSASDLSCLAALRRFSICFSRSRGRRGPARSRGRAGSRAGRWSRARRCRRRPAARTRRRRPRGCGRGTGCPGPRPAAPSTSPPMSTNCTLAGTTFAADIRPAGRAGRRGPWPRPRWDPWWRRRTAQRARRRRRVRCRARTCPRWADRRTRTVPSRPPTYWGAGQAPIWGQALLAASSAARAARPGSARRTGSTGTTAGAPARGRAGRTTMAPLATACAQVS